MRPWVGHLVQVGEACQILGDAQAQVEPGRLGHDRDPAADRDSVLGRERDSGDRCRARGRRDESAERPHGRCLPGTVRPEETEDLAVTDLEGDVLERDPVAEALAQVMDGQRRCALRRAGYRHSLRAHEVAQGAGCSLVPSRRRCRRLDRICSRRSDRPRRAPQHPCEPHDQVVHRWYRRAVPGWMPVVRRSVPRMTISVSRSLARRGGPPPPSPSPPPVHADSPRPDVDDADTRATGSGPSPGTCAAAGVACGDPACHAARTVRSRRRAQVENQILPSRLHRMHAAAAMAS